jgi:hypothetical protein
MGLDYDPVRPLPYPWVLDSDDGAEERDLFEDVLIGFQRTFENPYDFDADFVHLVDVPKDPEGIVGWRPVFAGDGGIYSRPDIQITSVQVIGSKAAR